MTNIDDFDVIHKVANFYFQSYVPEKKSFTHILQCKDGKKMTARFFLYYNTDDIIDVHKEML